MNDIQTHFDMLLSAEEQQRIGATPDKSDSMRVMRLLSEYNVLKQTLSEITFPLDLVHDDKVDDPHSIDMISAGFLYMEKDPDFDAKIKKWMREAGKEAIYCGRYIPTWKR